MKTWFEAGHEWLDENMDQLFKYTPTKLEDIIILDEEKFFKAVNEIVEETKDEQT